MRINYWTNSKLADRIRGIEKPEALTGAGWKEWEEKVSREHPIRYWIAEEGLKYLQDAVMWPVDRLYSVKYYIVNHWIDQSHALVAHPKHVKPGQWMDLDHRILYCLFDELVDFVEIEKAYDNYRWQEEKLKDLKWWQGGRWRTRTWRNAQAGIEHLKWETTLTDRDWIDDESQAKPTAQAKAAQEILELYTWWTETYPNRPDPYEESGWSALCESRRERGIGPLEIDPKHDADETHKILDRVREIEEQQKQEEDEMLIRLIKVRGHLWT